MSPETVHHSAYKQNLAADTDLARRVVANLARELPEVAERQATIEGQLVGLTEKHDISKELQDPTKSLVLVGLAAKLATAHEQGDDKYAAELDFSDIAVGLLTQQIDPQDGEIDDATKFGMYLEYENAPLSRQLGERIAQDGLLDDVKERMGITPENETPYVVHVLDMASEASMDGIAKGYSDYSGLGLSELLRLSDIDDSQNELIQDYKEGLFARAKELADRTKDENFLHMQAWVQYHEGVPHLFVMNPTAEKILNPEVTDNAPHYDDAARGRELALLEHEYVHTQDPLFIDGNIALGIGFEELRAEHFSGNKMGYQNIKFFFTDLQVVSGVDVAGSFNESPKGGTTEGLLRDLSRQIGLDAMVDILMAAPQDYCDRGVMKAIYEKLGGYDGVIGSLLAKKIEEGEAAVIEARIDKMAGTILATGEQARSTIARRKELGSNIIGDLVYSRMYPQEGNVSQ